MTTREDWLRACLTRVTAGWPAGADLPENTRISVGFPVKTKGRGAGRVSEHYRQQDSAGGIIEIFISPTIADALRVAEAVALEAAIIATGRSLSAAERDALKQRARAVAATLPAYPHAALNVGAKPDATGTVAGPGSRLIKAACPDCGYTLRAARKWLRVGVPSCPSGHGIMRVEARS